MDEFDSSFAQVNDPSEKNEEEDMELTKERLVLNPTSVRDRIDQNLEVLSNFKSRKDKSLSRSEMISNLANDLSEYYGYIPELSEFLLDLFSPHECVKFMDASDRPRPLVIRANSLKVTRKDLMDSLTKRGSNVEPVEWSKFAIKVTESSVPIGATPEYLAGHYMLQSASSLNPVMALAPLPNERILDMSAAPGGKTSYIAQLMKNTGTLIANDLKAQRQKATIANLHRMGVKNTIVTCYDGRKIPQVMKGFDRVLLDAPCSGLGVISRDQSVKLQRTMKDVQRIAHLQKELLCAAVDATDAKSKSPSGGVIVYSTCSITPEENEQVISYILSKRYVRLVDTGLEVGVPGLTRYREKRFHPSLTLTRRFYPHVHNMDGFYVAKLQKYKNGPREGGERVEGEEGEGEELEVDEEFDDENNGEVEGEEIDFEFVDEHGVVKMGKEQEEAVEEEEVVEELIKIEKSQKKGVKVEDVSKKGKGAPSLPLAPTSPVLTTNENEKLNMGKKKAKQVENRETRRVEKKDEHQEVMVVEKDEERGDREESGKSGKRALKRERSSPTPPSPPSPPPSINEKNEEELIEEKGEEVEGLGDEELPKKSKLLKKTAGKKKVRKPLRALRST